MRGVSVWQSRSPRYMCFEATGGQEWRLWSARDAAGVATRQLPPAQIEAFAASRGTRAKTDRIDAEPIARLMAFRPDAGRTLPHEKIRFPRASMSKRGQLVETRKRLLAQIEQIIATDESLARTAGSLRSVPATGPVASSMPIAELPELGQIVGDQAAARKLVTIANALCKTRQKWIAQAALRIQSLGHSANLCRRKHRVWAM